MNHFEKLSAAVVEVEAAIFNLTFVLKAPPEQPLNDLKTGTYTGLHSLIVLRIVLQDLNIHPDAYYTENSSYQWFIERLGWIEQKIRHLAAQVDQLDISERKRITAMVVLKTWSLTLIALGESASKVESDTAAQEFNCPQLQALISLKLLFPDLKK